MRCAGLLEKKNFSCIPHDRKLRTVQEIRPYSGMINHHCPRPLGLISWGWWLGVITSEDAGSCPKLSFVRESEGPPR